MINYFSDSFDSKKQRLNSARFEAIEPVSTYTEDSSASGDEIYTSLLCLGNIFLLDQSLPNSILGDRGRIVFFYSRGVPVSCEARIPSRFGSLNACKREDMGTFCAAWIPGDSTNADFEEEHIVHKMIPGRHMMIDAARIVECAFTSKSNSLAFLDGILPGVSLDPGTSISWLEWNSVDRASLIGRALDHDDLLIVRSSSCSEDSLESSQAGAFRTIMNVSPSKDILVEAVDSVFSSYGDPSDVDQVLIQKQITGVSIGGVCTTRVVGTLAPYYVISYDAVSGETDTVTSGASNQIETFYIARGFDIDNGTVPDPVTRVLEVARFIEDLLETDLLDIEFAFTPSNELCIFQVRPLVSQAIYFDDAEIKRRIQHGMQALPMQIRKPGSSFPTGSNVLGVMPDANPAELIGIKPKPMAFSLYQELITEDVVGAQRKEFGYVDVRPSPHMIKVCGTPYIDCRVSFSSFTSKLINENLSKKLVSLYLENLKGNPSFHDKVEFEIVATTWFPSIVSWLQNRYGMSLSSDEISEIEEANKDIFKRSLGRVNNDMDEVNSFLRLFDSINGSSEEPLKKSYLLIKACRDMGCKPFAHLARSGFIAVAILKDMASCSIISRSDYENILGSVSSVSTFMSQDAFLVKSGAMPKDDFVSRYGHLRPGTYDVTSDAYRDDVSKYIDPIIDSSSPNEKYALRIDSDTRSRIDKIFKDSHLNVDFDRFYNFCCSAIHGREYAKFVYTRFLSRGIDYLIEWGKLAGLQRHQLAYMTFGDIKEIAAGAMLGVDDVRSRILFREREYSSESCIELPELITTPMDLVAFKKTPGKPNFIGSYAIDAPVLKTLDAKSSFEISGRIAVIEGADPGYDWLFGQGISGLITCYGGANSHMAIRCAELGVPAAIGVGDHLYRQAQAANRALIDCANSSLRFL